MKKHKYITDGELSLIHVGTFLRRALDDIEYARKLIETADDTLGDVLHYKATVFDKLDRVTATLRGIEADVQKMIAEAGE